MTLLGRETQPADAVMTLTRVGTHEPVAPVGFRQTIDLCGHSNTLGYNISGAVLHDEHWACGKLGWTHSTLVIRKSAYRDHNSSG